MKNTPFILTLLFAAASLPSEAATFTPSSPDSNDRIVARIDYLNPDCFTTSTTLVTADAVRTTLLLDGCLFGPPPSTTAEFVAFGPLASGTYAYEVFIQIESNPPELLTSQTLVVVPASAVSIPTLDIGGQLLLALSLCVAGLLVTKRHG